MSSSLFSARTVFLTLILTAGSIPGLGWGQPQAPASARSPMKAANYALAFEGDDYVDMGPMNLSGEELTIEAWVKPDRFPNTLHTIAGIEERGADAALLRVGDASLASDRLQFVLRIGDSQVKLAARQSLDTNEWQHVAATYDGRQMRIYIDGELDARRRASGRVAGRGVFRVSKSFGGRYFFGTIDDVRVWRTARSERQIAQTRTLSLSRAGEDLLGYWPFNRGGGTRVVDGRAQGKADAVYPSGTIKGASWVQPGAPLNRSPQQSTDAERDRAAPKRFMMRFSDAYLVHEPNRGSPQIVAQNTVLSYGQDWEVQQMKDFLYHMRKQSWDGFFWKVNTARKEVYRVENGTFGDYGGREETLDIVVDPVGNPERPRRFFLRFPVSDLVYTTSSGGLQISLENFVISYGREWETEQLKPYLYHVRKRSWDGFFWKINTSRNAAWKVEGASFGGYGGQEEALDVEIEIIQ